MSYSAGGLPADLRVIQPADIRRFHDQHYFLANMGALVSLPKEIAPGAALARLDAILNQLQQNSKSGARPPVMTEAQLPTPKAAPAGRIEYVEYPLENAQQPGNVYLVWPADRKLAMRDKFLIQLFMDNVAGEPDTNLYKRLIDSKTRELDIGAKGVDGFVDDGQGNPVFITFRDMPVSAMTDANLASLRAKVLDEFAKIAAYPDGSPELAQFQQRLRSRIAEQRRALAKLVNSPPGFGFRGGDTAWLDRLYELSHEPGFRKTVTSKDDLAAIEKTISGTQNIWRDALKTWKLLGVTPYIEAAKPSPELVKLSVAEREQRLAAETARLRQKYGAASDQQALGQYREDYDRAAKIIDDAGKNTPTAKFVEHPPMTLDDSLDFKLSKLPGSGVPLVSSTFDSMTSATIGMALRLDGVPEDRLLYLSLMPALLMSSGVIENGKAISYEDMSQRLRSEILSLDASFSMNSATDRDELVVRGAGNNAAESKRAIEWMELALYHPNWRVENLSRLRDYVDQALARLRRTMQSAEENWVQNPETAYRKQENPLLLATSSFLTRTHNVQRLRWMLKSGGSDAVYGFLVDLSNVTGSRDERKAILATIRDGKYKGIEGLSPAERDLAAEAARDLDANLAEIPDSSLAADWRSLCAEMSRDLRQGPERTLAALDEVRRSILTTGGARMFVTGSSATQAQLGAGLQKLTAGLQNAPLKKAVYGSAKRIDVRLHAREPGAVSPLFVGLLNPNSQGGVFVNSAPLAGYRDTGREKLLDYLSANLYAGHGAHGVFMKTWAAGLAYSNGIRVYPETGRLLYYAERTPELPQTLKFVINILKSAQPDASLTDYAVAGAFQSTRIASSYEIRGEGMAADLADGLTPEIITRFHRAILDLKKSPDLEAELFRRQVLVDAKVLPGMGANPKDVAGAIYFVIGPEKQMAAWEQYLQQADAPDARVWRLYPRDFWLTGE